MRPLYQREPCRRVRPLLTSSPIPRLSTEDEADQLAGKGCPGELEPPIVDALKALAGETKEAGERLRLARQQSADQLAAIMRIMDRA